MPERPTGEREITDYPAVIDDGSRERLAAIVAFFETRCPNCVEHYCPDCMFRFEKMIIEAAEFLAEGEK